MWDNIITERSAERAASKTSLEKILRRKKAETPPNPQKGLIQFRVMSAFVLKGVTDNFNKMYVFVSICGFQLHSVSVGYVKLPKPKAQIFGKLSRTYSFGRVMG